MQDFTDSEPATQEELLESVGHLMSTSAGAAGLHGLEERLDRNEFDLVAIGRALIANPDLPILLSQGKWEDVRPYDAEMLAELR